MTVHAIELESGSTSAAKPEIANDVFIDAIEQPEQIITDRPPAIVRTIELPLG